MQGLRSGDCDQALVGGCQINYRYANELLGAAVLLCLIIVVSLGSLNG